MLLGGFSSKQLLNRLSVNQVITGGFIGMAIGVISLLMMWWTGSQSTVWFGECYKLNHGIPSILPIINMSIMTL